MIEIQYDGRWLNLLHIAAWRADCAQHHRETIDSVRSTANEQVPFNVQGVRNLPVSDNMKS